MENVVIVLSAYEAERKKVVETIRGRFTHYPSVFFDMAEVSFRQLLQELGSFDLFASKRVIVVDKVELLKKDEVEKIAECLPRASQHLFLILSGSSIKGKWSGIKTHDLTQEKPWERLPRLKLWLQEEAKQAGKVLQTAAASLLVESLEDFGLLQQELIKLTCYVGERPTIELQDVKTMMAPSLQMTGWELAESVVWEGKSAHDEPPFEVGYIGQIRYHLQIGFQMAVILESGRDVSEMLSIQGLKPRTMDKYLPLVRKRGLEFFKRGLEALFTCELGCKNGVSPQLLWTRFKGELLR